MKRTLRSTAVLLCLAAFITNCGQQRKGQAQTYMPIHTATEWQVRPCFKFDVLCFLNALTADPFYLRYYQEEYDKFQPSITPAAQDALSNLKRKIKDENQGIISAFLCLYFSATDDETMDEMLLTLNHSMRMQSALKQTPYYSEAGWQLYDSVREDLKSILLFLKDIQFESYWKENVLPRVRQKIELVEKDLPAYNVIAEVERHLGFALPSNRITVYMLYFSQPHGIKVTGTRFLTDVAWPFEIVLRNAVHEMMHPPYDLVHDDDLRKTFELLKKDEFLMDTIKNHNPAFGYNSFEGFIEEDCVQALEQIINEKFGIEVEPRKRWKESDDGMHVFSAALYKVLKEEKYNQKGERFRDFLIRTIQEGKLAPGTIKKHRDAFFQ